MGYLHVVFSQIREIERNPTHYSVLIKRATPLQRYHSEFNLKLNNRGYRERENELFPQTFYFFTGKYISISPPSPFPPRLIPCRWLPLTEIAPVRGDVLPFPRCSLTRIASLVSLPLCSLRFTLLRGLAFSFFLYFACLWWDSDTVAWIEYVLECYLWVGLKLLLASRILVLR